MSAFLGKVTWLGQDLGCMANQANRDKCSAIANAAALITGSYPLAPAYRDACLNQLCNGNGLPTPEQTACLLKSCPSGHKCILGQCVPVNVPPTPFPTDPGCSSAKPCPAGFVCVNGDCVPNASTPTAPTTPTPTPTPPPTTPAPSPPKKNGTAIGWLIGGTLVLLGVGFVATNRSLVK